MTRNGDAMAEGEEIRHLFPGGPPDRRRQKRWAIAVGIGVAWVLMIAATGSIFGGTVVSVMLAAAFVARQAWGAMADRVVHRGEPVEVEEDHARLDRAGAGVRLPGPIHQRRRGALLQVRTVGFAHNSRLGF